MAADGAGNLYAADALSHVIVKMMPNGSYETIAGNSFPGLDSGDGGPGRNASLNTPCGIAVDTAGNVYFGDKTNHRIRRITPAGIISTYAGTGRAGSSGDDGPAVSATLNFPCHLALDNSGALYFHDERGFRIRRISPDGRISTIAGNGKNEWGPYGPAVGAGVREVSGLAVSGDGTVYVSSLASNHIRRIKDGRLEIFAGTGENKFGGDGEPALNASFSRPEGLAVNSAGELFVCDRESSRVRKIDSGGKVSTIAGSRYDLGGDNGPASEALFRLPFSLASAADGSIYVMDNGSLTIRRIDAKSTVTWVAGDGFFRHAQDGTAAKDSFLLAPMGVAFDRNGVMYVADAGSSRVRRIDADGLLQTIAGIGVEDYRSSDNIPARRAFLNSPAGVAVDASGNVYIADALNNRIRRIDTKDNITTWAGDGGNDSSGDDGPAAKASLYHPQGILFDAQGNLLIADLRNYRIRKVSPDGSKITSIAGNGRAVHSGDGGPAVTAGLREPFAIAVDSKENIYIADGIGHRVRKISKGGTISTFTGDGTAGSKGDGGPVGAATVNYPTSVVVDSADNVYIGERGGSRVRRVDAITEVITTIAGTGTPDFSGDGGLGVNASLKAPSIGLAVDSSGSLYIADTGNHRIRKVSAVQAKIAAAPNAVTFTGTGSLIHQLELTSDIAGGMPFTATAQFESGGEWLNLSTGNGSFPSALNITANRSGLAAGTYKATVLISAPGAQPPQLRVPVTLVVGESEQPQLKIESSPITLSLFEGAAPYTQLIRITNPSSVPVNVTLAAEGGSWLTLDSQGGRVSAAEPLVVTMTIDPAQLTTGTFQGSLIASGTASGKSIADRVPVVTVVKKSQKVILLSQTGLSYFAVAGGGAPLPHSISIANVGVGAMDWTATVVSQTGGNWLKIGSNSGSVQTPFVDASDLTVNADTSNLQPGEYYARIDVRAPGADNSPQTMTAVLNVYPAGTSLGPEVRPTSLFFVGGPGLQPAAKSVLVGNTSASVISYESTGQTFDQAPWLSYAPARAAVAPGKPAEIQVQPNLSSLSPGIRDGKVTLRFSDQSTFEINVTSIVSPTPVDIKTGRSAAKTCSGKNLRLLPTTLGHTVRGTAGQPVSVEAVVVDDSGPFTKERCNASVSLAVVHENVRVTLDSHSNGKWTKSWTPKKSTSPTRVTGYITAFAMGPNNRPIADQFPITIEVGATGRTPQVASGKVLNSASSVPDSTSAPGTLISAPGTLISIYGNNLAAAIPAIADSVPHPIVLAETRVTLGGRDLPLGFASNGQLNAQVPYDLPANTVHQLLVFRPDATSGAEEITIAPSQPAVFTVNEQGTGQARVNNAATNVAADMAHPVRAGDVIVIYCTGLGRVDPAVPEGSAAPSNPASQAINPVTVTIGGVEAKVNFAGLAPGFVGVSQVNAIVPAGTQLGSEVPLILTVGGQVSPVVTIAVR
ncbi:MAG: hypothetical protein H7Y20_08245 [Bryobacteraceae bacterium]|nr:hypothetical protein [Bryobacteraceae bacterium]